METTDKQLVDAILRGSEAALYEFYKRYKHKLLTLIRSKVSREQDAEELLQDTFYGFLESIRDFHGQSQVKTFLYAICHHKIIDYYRRKKIKHIVFSQMPQLEMLVSPLIQPEEYASGVEFQQKIQQAFESITPLYKTILQYKYIEGRSVEEIARLLSLTFKSAESKLFRARKAFVVAYSQLP